MRSDRQTPDGWRMVRLEEVAQVNPRRPVLSIELQTPITFVPMASVGEKSAGILCPEQREYREVAKGYTYFEENNVLFAKITPCLQNGKHALASGLRGGFGFGTTEFHVIRADPNIEPRHLFRVLTQPQNIDKCVRSFSGTAGQQRVQPEVLKSLPILLPPLVEQRAIAGVLDAIDEAIGQTEAVIAATERLRDSLLHELLTRGVPGWHSEWKEVAGVGTVPACWEVVRLGEVVESTTYGTNMPLDGRGAVPVLRMSNLQNGEVDLTEVRRADLDSKEFSELNLVTGDILFNRTNSLGLVGKVAVVRDLPQPISFASYLVRLRAQQARANPFWLSALLWSGVYQRRIRRLATPGVSQANINPTSLKSLTIPLPPMPEQQALAGALDAVGESLERAHDERDGLQSLKLAAADALLMGRIRTSVFAL